MKKILSLIMATVAVLPLSVTAFAAKESAKEASVPEDSFDSVYLDFTHDDGSVTEIYRDGGVVTKYPDGSFEAVDSEGNRHTGDKDGTYTVYGTDGSVAVERPDGTRELTEKNGKKLVINPDGSGKTVYSMGLVIEFDSEAENVAAYFEGGKDRLLADENGNFPHGEITGKNGEKLTNSENGLYLKGKNGIEYSVSDDEKTASITHPDGSYFKSENGNAEMRFSDGGILTYTSDGTSKCVAPDGSYLVLGEDSQAWEMYNATDGTRVKVNEQGEIADMYVSDGDYLLNIKDGKIAELDDPDSGIHLQSDENGTTFKTPDGTYFTDGTNVMKDGQPLGSSGKNTVPSNYVPAGEIFKLSDGEGLQPEDYDKVDGFFLELDYITSSTSGMDDSNALYGKDTVFTPETFNISQTINEKPTVSFTRDRKDGYFYLNGTYNWKHIYPGEGYSLEGGGYLKNEVFRSEIRYTLSDFSFEDGYVYADVSGHLYAYGGTNDSYEEDASSVDLNQNHAWGKYRIMGDALYIVFTLENTDSSSRAVSSSLYFKVAGVLPEGEKDTEDPYVPYKGRLTYNNGAVNKHGQPWPDLMDFDGDGDIDYADRQIQHILVHNPDALDTPEGAALVMTAVLAALLGAGGGVAMAVYSAATGAAGVAETAGGFNFDLTFADEENDETDGDETDGEEEEAEENSGQSSGGAQAEQPEEPEDTEDLGEYIQKDSDGDLNVKDPVTGEERLYKSNGDGTYTNPLTGVTYTEAELKSSLESREENSELIAKDAAAAKEAIDSQREESGNLSDFSKEIEEKSKKELAEAEAAEKKQAYTEKLELKYNADGTELKKAIMTEQIEAEVESNNQMANEAYYKAAQKTAESTEKAADLAIDVMAEIAGPEGEAIKDAYTFTKSTLARGSEAYAEGRSVTEGVIHGAIEGSVSVAQNHVEDPAGKLAANVGGDMFKAALESTAKGEKIDIEKVVEAGGMAAINTSIDVALDDAGELTKHLVKDDAEAFFKTDDEDD